MKSFLPACFCLISFLLIGCPDSGVQPVTNPLLLSIEDVTCTEAYLKLSLAEGETQRTLTLKRDDSTIAVITMTGNDSLFIDEGLLPKRIYTYTLTASLWSSTAQTTTMDTTDDSFGWQMDTLGNSITNQSVLYDVAIINDTLAYAVGEIHTKETDRLDSTGKWVEAYNAARWDGVSWKIFRIQFFVTCRQTDSYPFPAKSVFAFSEKNVWISMGGDQVAQWNGDLQTTTTCLPVISYSTYRLWGDSPASIIAVGSNGGIVEYNGSSWQKVESGTNLHLVDIYGSNDVVLAAGVDNINIKGIIIKKNDGKWETMAESEIVPPNALFRPKLYGSISSVWIDEKNTIYAGCNLLFKYQFNKWGYVKSLPENYIGGNPNVYYRGFLTKIRGNKSNDMWIAGDRNTLRHFNGKTWAQVGLPYDPMSDIIWRSLDVRNNFCVAVGDGWGQAICIRIKR